MSNYLDEAQVEIVAVDSFRELECEYIHRPATSSDSESPDRTDYAQVGLTRRLRDARVRTNPDAPEGKRVPEDDDISIDVQFESTKE